MQLKDVIQFLEAKAPPSLQEDYDNSGLLTGDPEQPVTGVMVCLDSTEAVIEEAKAKGCNVVVAHHPIVFSGLRRLTGRNYIERTVIKAIRENVAIYAIHTNLDNVRHGVNQRICDQLGLVNTRILSPKSGQLSKLVIYCTRQCAEPVRQALFSAGAGTIGEYDECSFNSEGTGTFRPGDAANPAIGRRGVRESVSEMRVEVVVPKWRLNASIAAARAAHDYEEMAYDVIPLSNDLQDTGSGMIGELAEPMPLTDALNHIKTCMKAPVIRHTAALHKTVQRIAVCGGSGSFLLGDAVRAGADVFVTADFKYHQFFDADGRIVIADIGHFESEQYTIDLLYAWLSEKFRTFATHKTGVVTNPINYL
jgi:dinuclear metal center YbgI/SA1388 family protein